MKESAAKFYMDPYSGNPLELVTSARDNVDSGMLHSPGGRVFPIVDGVPNFVTAETVAEGHERDEIEFYEARCRSYDAAIDWLFASFYADEAEVRARLHAPLHLKQATRVLEVGCGTCRDSVGIAGALRHGSLFFAQDLSSNMLQLGRARMAEAGPFACDVEFFCSSAAKLPFPDHFFDAVFHFGGFNLFGNLRQCLTEMSRVVRPGGRVVVGDESLAPWLRETTYGRILLRSHPLYEFAPPLALLPENAENVALEWLLGNAFYLLSFTMGTAPPRLDLDLPIVGPRGGTHRTRNFGLLEGVSVEARKMALSAAREAGLSLHEWLDRAVRAAARKDPEQ